MLQRQDLTRKAVPILNHVEKRGGLTVVTHPQSTNRIDYMSFLFEIRDLPEEYLRLLGIFKTLFSVLDTGEHSYASLGHEINIATGGIGAVIGSYRWYGDKAEEHAPRLTFEVTVKALHKNLRAAFALVREILMTTEYHMPQRVLEVLEEERAGMRAAMASAGHATAAQRALSYLSENAALMDMISGLGAYDTLDAVCTAIEDPAEAEKLCAQLQRMSKAIFRADNLIFDCTACEEDLPEILTCAEELAQALNPPAEFRNERYCPVPEKKNEGLTTAGQVQFVCRAGRYDAKGLESTGVFRVLRVLLGYEYLWGRKIGRAHV